MLTVDEAQALVLDAVSALPPRRMSLLEALGCVLAEPVVAPIALPPFDNSAMDGFAVIAQDTRGATAEAPRAMKVIEDVPAGSEPQRRVQPGTAARIMTGAPVPAGADAVLLVEHTRPGLPGEVDVLAAAKPGDNIRPRGEDIEPGEVALAAGQALGPGELGLAAALGGTEVSAIRPPRVVIITTGSEVVAPGEELRPGAIYDSNQVTMAASVLAAGAQVARCMHAADDEAAVAEALADCGEADLIITVGGVSVGDYDLVKTALQRVGEIKFWRILMKPGKPVAFGHVDGRALFGLPGNPVSALVTFELLVAPVLRKLAGRTECLPAAIKARLLSDVSHKPPRREYVQAVTRRAEDGYVVQPQAKRGSAMLTSTVGANSLVVLPEESRGERAGDLVEVIPAAGAVL